MCIILVFNVQVFDVGPGLHSTASRHLPRLQSYVTSFFFLLCIIVFSLYIISFPFIIFMRFFFIVFITYNHIFHKHLRRRVRFGKSRGRGQDLSECDNFIAVETRFANGLRCRFCGGVTLLL